MEFVKSKKGKIILLISFLVLVAIAVLIAIMLSRNKEGFRTIKVSEVSGKVSVVNNGIEYEAYPGMLLQEGYAIVTSADSYVRMVLDDDKYIKLESGSRIVFEKLGLLGSGKTTINLERGTITNEIVYPLGEDEDYIINTPNAVLAVRGTFFRVALGTTDTGEITTDVLTYGGAVASQRIKPDGNVVDEEVLIDAGYMTTVQMNKEDTIYIVESTESERENTIPIVREKISDEDLIDIYFASENGHAMFLSPEEIVDEITERDLKLEKQTSVYEKAEKLNSGSAVTSPDDGEPLVKEEETEVVEQVQGAPTDGGHTHVRVENTVEATCTVPGKTIVRCSACDEIFSETEIPSTGHTETTRTVEATCTTAGKTTVSCDVCNEIFSETERVATGHKEVTGGTEKSHSQCETCGEVLSTAHSYADSVTKTASCTEVGETTHTCGCGYSYTEEIPVLGHTEVNGGTETSHSKCETCGEVLSTAHSYTDTLTKVATCTETGETTHTCSCGYSYTEETPALGHTDGTPTVTVEATCTTDGTHTTKCTVCGEITAEETILATGHTEETSTIAATCTVAGKTTVSCSVCNEIISETEIAATGHMEVNGGTSTVHTKCETCGDVLKTTHTYTDTITQEATCTDIGETTHACDCGYSYTTEIAATGHTEVDGATETSHTECQTCGIVLNATHSYTDTVTKNATCTVAGETTHSCACGYGYTTEIAATGHTEGTTTNTLEPTCTDDGWYSTDCSVCGSVIREGVVSATGHTEGTTTVITAATCETDGQAEVLCEDCDTFIRYETLSATGHTKTDESASETTCVNCGCAMVDFDSTNFPDATFLSLLQSDGIDTNGDGVLVGSEITNVFMLDYSSAGITDATGIEHFTALQSLNLSGNSLTDVPCENLTGLTYLNLGSTDITSVDVTGCPNLTQLDLTFTSISTLDLSSSSQLTYLNLADCSNITAIDLTYNQALVNIQLQGTGLTAFEIDGYQYLEELWINVSTLETLTVTNCPSLTTLNGPNESTNALVSLDITGCSSLTSVYLETVKLTLQTFIADKSGLSGKLDVYNFTALQTLRVEECYSLTGLEISGCTSLTSLTASNSALAYVNATGCTSLTAPNVAGCTYVAETGSTTVDLTSLDGFDASKVTIVSGGSYADGVFTFDADSDTITYTYDFDNGCSAEFSIINY